MAQIVTVEPGDVLVIGRQEGFSVEHFRPAMDRLKEILGLSMIVVLDGPVDLAVVRRTLAEGGADAVAGS